MSDSNSTLSNNPDPGNTQYEKPDLADKRHSGWLAWWAKNHVASNMLMLFLLIAGLYSALNIRLEVFPAITIDIVSVQVPYLGATPEEVEESVVVRIEEAVSGVSGIKRLRATAAEGVGTVLVELDDDADLQQVRNDIEAAVDRIETFPEETEKPVITELSTRVQVLSVVLYGDVPERTLKQLAERFRDDITAKDNVSQADIAGMRNYEISIELSETALRKYNLTFDQVADAVRRSALDLPGGTVKTKTGEILIRTKGQKYTARDYENIKIISNPDNTTLYLRDIAKVVDGFEDIDMFTYFNGKRAAMINVFRIGEQDAIDVQEATMEQVEAFKQIIPEGVQIGTWFDRTEFLRGRLELLARNAYMGLILVFISLTLFLDLRLAFWTTMGIPISFLGAFLLLPHFDITINMISLFAFIVVLGIVVDDAIVVGENIFALREKGMKPLDAAIEGAKEMAAPVTLAITTTVVAFVPLMMTEGFIGKIMETIPVVVVAVLLMSLVEALIILPAHLGRIKHRTKKNFFDKILMNVQSGLEWVIQKPYLTTLNLAIRWRYVAFALSVSLGILVAGYVGSGAIKGRFWPDIDSDTIGARLVMPQGTPSQSTRDYLAKLEQAAIEIGKEFDQRAGRTKDEDRNFIRYISTSVGDQPFSRLIENKTYRTGAAGGDAHLGEVIVEILQSEYRESEKESSAEFATMWRERVGELVGAESVKYSTSILSVGDPVSFELSHRNNNVLETATEDFKQRLDEIAGVTEIADSFEPGKIEMKLDLKPHARNLNLTLDDLARQVRQGFYGEEAVRIQRGRDDVKVMVRYLEEERNSLQSIENMRIRTPDGTEVPFSTVADVSMGRGYAEISRTDRRRIVSVTADIDESIANANDVNALLLDEVLPELIKQYDGLMFSFEGEQREQAETVSSLGRNFMIAMLGIFGLLGIQFRSYLQPLIVMSAIPFGLIGAIGGHVIMGYIFEGKPMTLSFLSGFGVVALTGVVVNDSLIMVDLINRERKMGIPVHQIVLDCGVKRFRPILLTTLTTFSGLTPMLLERSLQAKFLVPMAISLAFGVAFATFITLILVPILYMILEDIRSALGLVEEPE